MSRAFDKSGRQPLVAKAALVIIDIRKSSFGEHPDDAVPAMPGFADRVARTRVAVERAREASLPVIFVQEQHRTCLVDFSREVEGEEGVHCLDISCVVPAVAGQMGLRKEDLVVPKERYSAFYGTDLDALLRNLGVDTLLLTGGLTDVCVHYTFVDACQSDYTSIVLEDCVAGSCLEAHDAALRAMEFVQPGSVRTLDEVVSAVLDLEPSS